MGSASLALKQKYSIRTAIIDIAALGVIYFAPALSHLISLPVYYIEPMRLMIILSVAHSRSYNTYLLVFTLPVFSHLVSAHPALVKTTLITGELLIFTSLYYLLSTKYKRLFFIMLVSIISGKVFYYLAKYLIISYGFLQAELISTPVIIQIITAVLYSAYTAFILNKHNKIFSKFQHPVNGRTKK